MQDKMKTSNSLEKTHDEQKKSSETQKIFARLAPIWYFVVAISTIFIGTQQTLQIVFKNWSPEFILCQQIFCYVCFIEMMANWLCLRYVTSDFTKKDETKFGHLKFVITMQDVREKLASPEFLGGNFRHGQKADDMTSEVGGKSERELNVYRRHLSHSVNERTNDVDYKKKDLAFPYWSWKPCEKCDVLRPPRVHHCPICDKCSLKRDHHCYFTGTCVALRNHRHFIAFCFWTCLITAYSSINFIIYLYIDATPQTSCLDLLPPAAILRFFTGHTQFYYVIIVALIYCLIWSCFVSIYFFKEHLSLVLKGLTTYENDQKVKIHNSRSQYKNWKATFGRYWMLDFIIPVHFFFEQQDNGIEYRNINVWYMD